MHTKQEGNVGHNWRGMEGVLPVRHSDGRLQCMYHPQSPVLEMKIIGLFSFLRFNHHRRKWEAGADVGISAKGTGFCHPSGMEDFLFGKAPHRTLIETPEYPEWVWTATSQSAGNEMVTCVNSARYRAVLAVGADAECHVRPLETDGPNEGFYPWGGPLVCRFQGPPAPRNSVPSVLPHAGLRRRPQPAGRRPAPLGSCPHSEMRHFETAVGLPWPSSASAVEPGFGRGVVLRVTSSPFGCRGAGPRTWCQVRMLTSIEIPKQQVRSRRRRTPFLAECRVGGVRRRGTTLERRESRGDFSSQVASGELLMHHDCPEYSIGTARLFDELRSPSVSPMFREIRRLEAGIAMGMVNEVRGISFVPDGTSAGAVRATHRWKRWAIIGRPYGTSTAGKAPPRTYAVPPAGRGEQRSKKSRNIQNEFRNLTPKPLIASE